ETLHDLVHPAGPLAAGGALAARLVCEESTDIVQNIDDAGGLVEDGDGGGAEAETADLARPVEVERRVELRLGHQSHADAAGDAALGLRSLPDAAAVVLDQIAHGDAERELDAARLVDVPADAVQLRPVAAGVARVLRIGRHADRLEPIHAASDDVRDA